jgi:hypothetical protein
MSSTNPPGLVDLPLSSKLRMATMMQNALGAAGSQQMGSPAPLVSPAAPVQPTASPESQSEQGGGNLARILLPLLGGAALGAMMRRNRPATGYQPLDLNPMMGMMLKQQEMAREDKQFQQKALYDTVDLFVRAGEMTGEEARNALESGQLPRGMFGPDAQKKIEWGALASVLGNANIPVEEKTRFAQTMGYLQPGETLGSKGSEPSAEMIAKQIIESLDAGNQIYGASTVEKASKILSGKSTPEDLMTLLALRQQDIEGERARKNAGKATDPEKAATELWKWAFNRASIQGYDVTKDNPDIANKFTPAMAQLLSDTAKERRAYLDKNAAAVNLNRLLGAGGNLALMQSIGATGSPELRTLADRLQSGVLDLAGIQTVPTEQYQIAANELNAIANNNQALAEWKKMGIDSVVQEYGSKLQVGSTPWKNLIEPILIKAFGEKQVKSWNKQNGMGE